MSWSKVHTQEWLFGSIRKYPPEVRAIFIDLQAMATDSVFTGFVCVTPSVGYENKQLAKAFNCTVENIEKSLAIFIQEKYISIDENGVIKIHDWSSYQNEYQRLAKYKIGTKKSTKKSTKKNTEKGTSAAVSVSVSESESESISELDTFTLSLLREGKDENGTNRQDTVSQGETVDDGQNSQNEGAVDGPAGRIKKRGAGRQKSAGPVPRYHAGPGKPEFVEYCKQNGFGQIAERAFNGYDATRDEHGQWYDASGKLIKNWKQKLWNGWFKPENKDGVAWPASKNQPESAPRPPKYVHFAPKPEDLASPDEIKRICDETLAKISSIK
jgi:hypothetical protein